MSTPKPSEETLIISFNSEFKQKKYIFSLYDIGNDSIKIVTLENNDNNDDLFKFNKFGITLKLEELKNLHRYFRMFDEFEDTKSYISDLCKVDSIKIIDVKENEIAIKLDLRTVQNDSMMISLNKMKYDEKEEIAFLIKGYEQQKKEIKELKNTVSDLKTIISNLTKRIEKLEGKLDNNVNNNIINGINSNIIKNDKEINLLFKAMSTQEDNISLKLLYNSKIEGENAEKLKQAYLGKNDIIVLVKTKKDKRFGGYAHEIFQISGGFEQSDNKAFLFNLDKMKIYKSKGGPLSIWNYEGNSIDFGTGTDLRVFYEFFHKQNYTNQSTVDYNYDEKFALNGEKFFEVKYLEIYQVIFN